MTVRYGYESRASKSLLLDFWLIIGRGEYSTRPSVRVTAAYPKLARNERAINLKVELPLALFEIPSLSAHIRIDQPDQAISIDTSAIAEAVRNCIGMDVEIAVASPEAGQ
ncbi:MAG: hypothetical protein IT552_02435 [Sphingomonadaceae bacterium]|nr:hypothetical protein [Sphingomonadaceae bacterium]